MSKRSVFGWMVAVAALFVASPVFAQETQAAAHAGGEQYGLHAMARFSAGPKSSRRAWGIRPMFATRNASLARSPWPP